jgi:hypothetical protein
MYSRRLDLKGLLAEMTPEELAAKNKRMRLMALSRWENEGGAPFDPATNPEKTYR